MGQTKYALAVPKNLGVGDICHLKLKLWIGAGIFFTYVYQREKKQDTAMHQLRKSSRSLKSIYGNASIKLNGLGLLIIIKKSCQYVI